MTYLSLFKTKKEEILPALIVTFIFTIIQVFTVYTFYDSVALRLHGSGGDFLRAMPISGFDAYAYSIITDGTMPYHPIRHPLIELFYFPLYGLNLLLINITGINCAQFIFAILLLACVFLSYIFSYRIFREIIGLPLFDSNLLSVMLFGIAYVMISMIIPDHFAFSMTLLVIALYVSGKIMKSGKQLSVVQTWALFVPTAGVTLSNGVKVVIDALFVNGKRFFNLRYLFLAIILPSALLLAIAGIQNSIREDWNKEVFNRNDQLYRQQILQQIADTASIKDSMYIQRLFDKEVKRRMIAKYRRNHKYDYLPKTKFKTLASEGFLSWIDTSTPRWESLTENFFGESIQLHKEFLLFDVANGRPVIIHYKSICNYLVEALLLLLVCAGIWCGRRSKFLWMCLAGMMFDIFIHVILGFALNEVYIMTANWAFVIPIAIGYLFATTNNRNRILLRLLVMMLSVFLWVYNGQLLLSYLSNIQTM